MPNQIADEIGEGLLGSVELVVGIFADVERPPFNARIPSGRSLYTSTNVSSVRLGEISPISFMETSQSISRSLLPSFFCAERKGQRRESH